MNIVLIGYRGTGKSVVGQILAKRLNMDYVGMDANVVQRAGMPIPQIVEKFGWPGFRDIETEEALDLAGRDNMVIDSGGGVIERPENIRALAKNGTLFWLKASVDTIVKRIAGDDQRPALTEGKSFTEEVAEVLEARRSKYQSAAQYEIDTDMLTPEQVAEKIISLYSLTSDYILSP
ncbi:MAG: shikimate kinase [Desulfobacteraceae bacterium]|jgi:shikimate kinase